jgi:capsular polysaccharide biosynthesis protein
MSGEKVLNLIDITAAGKEVPLAALGAEGGPITFARVPDCPPLHLTAPLFLNRPEFAKVFPAGAVQRHEPMVCAVEDCFLLGPFGYVVLPSGMLIRQSVVNFDGNSVQYTLEQFKAQFPGRNIPWGAASAPVFAAHSYSTNNYFHFLIDALAQLHWRDRIPAAQNAKVIVSGYPPQAETTLPFMAGAMARAGITAADVQPFDGTLMFCRKVIFPRRNTGANPWKVRWLREHLGVAGRGRGKARLYVARGPVPRAVNARDSNNGDLPPPRRRVVNEAAVEKLLAGHGFTAVNPGALSITEQVELFADAAVVVGAHGAGLTNAAFMAPGGALVELTHAKRVVWTYHEVAGAAGLSYACVVGDIVGDSSQPIFADFSVDLDALDVAVKAALAAL